MTTDAVSEAQPDKAARRHSAVRFPAYPLAEAVRVAHVIHTKGGGLATNDQLAAFLGYKSANNGAYITKVAAAKLFGLIEWDGGGYCMTQLAQKILMSVYAIDTNLMARIEGLLALSGDQHQP